MVIFRTHSRILDRKTCRTWGFYMRYLKTKAFGDEDTIFEDMDVLNPNEQTYQPESLPEREVELDQIHSALRPATMGSTPLNLIVYGQSGQGKTVGIRLKTDQLQEYADDSEMDLTVVYIRCKGMDGSYQSSRISSSDSVRNGSALVRSSRAVTSGRLSSTW